MKVKQKQEMQVFHELSNQNWGVILSLESCFLVPRLQAALTVGTEFSGDVCTLDTLLFRGPCSTISQCHSAFLTWTSGDTRMSHELSSGKRFLPSLSRDRLTVFSLTWPLGGFLSYSNLNMENKTKQKSEKHVISPVFNFTKQTCKFHSGSECFKRLWLLGLSLICLHRALCCVSLGVSGPLLWALGV